MSAYATTREAAVGIFDPAIPHIGGIMEQFVEMLAVRVAERLQNPPAVDDDWLDTRAAAAHLGVHRDTLRRLAAERSIASEQSGPGCKLFFRRSDLDAWRRSERRGQAELAGAGR
jgi:excisionase family DNA binding protein